MSVIKKRIRINLTVRIWAVYTISLILIFLVFFGIARGWFGYMPSFEELENPERNLASEVYSADGYLLGTYYIENRSDINYSDLPPHLVEASGEGLKGGHYPTRKSSPLHASRPLQAAFHLLF